MHKKTIRVELSPQGIDRAITELKAYKAGLRKKCESLVQALTDRGVEIAKMQVASLGAMSTGELAGSITGYYKPSTGVGIVEAGAWYAMYVEFGTGVIGAGAPHPEPDGWQYDINKHGEEGWWYYDEGEWHFTRGMPSRPFMYNTAMELERQCEAIAKEVFGR